MNYELFMAEAIAEARRGAAQGEEAIGAVAVIDDAMVARDHDRSAETGDPTAHAVLLTLQAAARKLGRRRLAEATIFTTLEPCPMCAGALVLTRVSRLVYGPQDPRAGAAYSLYNIPQDPRLNHFVEITPDVLARESAGLLRAFFERRRAGAPGPG